MSNGHSVTKSNWTSSAFWSNRNFSNSFPDGSRESVGRKGFPDELEGKTGSSSLLESSESEPYNRSAGVPWHTNGTNSKSISPARPRLSDQPSSTTSQNSVRSSSPFLNLGANVERHNSFDSLHKPVGPPIINGPFHSTPESSIFTGFHGRDNSISAFSNVTMSPHLPSLSRSISHTDSYSMKHGYSSNVPVNERNISRATTSSSISQSRNHNNGVSSSVHHNQNSVSLMTDRQPQLEFGSPFNYENSVQQNDNSFDLVADFSNMVLQNTDRPSDLAGIGSFSNGTEVSGGDSSVDRHRYQVAQSSAYSAYNGHSLEQSQDNQYQPPQQDFFRPARGSVSGYLASNAGNYRRPGHNPSYPASSNAPMVQDMLNPSRGTIPPRNSNQSATIIDRKMRVLNPLQQEPASYIPSHMHQAGQLQPQMQYPYEFASYAAIRANSLVNPYIIPTAYMNYGQQALTPQYNTGRNNEPIRSQKLEEFRQNVKNNKRHELKEIFGNVAEFATDQHASRFIQQKLETANSDEKEQIFKEIQPNSLQLMTDLFGNYVIQKLFEHGTQAQKRILANQMKGHIRSLSLGMYGCRVVQKALEHVFTEQQAALISELNGKGIVMECVKDQNGNHVIQKAIERVPAEHVQFILDAFLGQIPQLATHSYGCRVIQRMLEHCQEYARREILNELHACIPSLIVDQFGNYVIQHVIEHGDEGDRSRIVAIVIKDVLNFSKHKFASNVVEKSIEFGAPAQRAEILRLLTTTNERGQPVVDGLVRDQYGNYVIQKVLTQLKGAERENLINQIRPLIVQMKKVSCGKQILAIEKIINDADFEATQSSRSSTNASTVDGPVTPGQSIGLASPPASINGSTEESMVKTPTGTTIISDMSTLA